MNQLVVTTFADQAKLDDAIKALRKLRAERSVALYASAVVARSVDRELSVREIAKEGHGGTKTGALIGALAGSLAGPAATAIMAAGGAMIGEVADQSAEEDFVKFANAVAERIVPGGGAIVVDVAEDGAPAFEAAMQGLGGAVLS